MGARLRTVLAVLVTVLVLTAAGVAFHGGGSRPTGRAGAAASASAGAPTSPSTQPPTQRSPAPPRSSPALRRPATRSATPAPVRPGFPTDTVVLGDSYASGVAVPPYDTGTDVPGRDICRRSAGSWPRRLGVTPALDLACSGAVIADLTTTGRALTGPDVVPQVRRLASVRRSLRARRRDVAAVAVMVGGNDVGFGSVLGQCYFGTCLAHLGPERARIAAMQRELTAALRQVRAAAPRARVYLVGYPRLFPRRQRSVTGCSWVSGAERSAAVTVSADLDAAQGRAARAAGATFIATSTALSGHELCTGSRSWLVPFDPAALGSYEGQAHPLAQGQRAIARQVSAALARL